MERLVLVLVLVLLLPSVSTISGDSSAAGADELALVSFKGSLLSDPTGALSSWEADALHHCSWRGVACGHHDGRVTNLTLNSLNLTGSIPLSLSNLTSLTWLDLSGNRLTGHIPTDLGRLVYLRHLNLKDNSLEGEIPTAISRLSGLRSLVLANNNLHGRIPSNLSLCSNLSILCLDNNMLTGAIPDSLATLPRLSSLFLNKNKLGGEIPSWLGTMASLTSIYLSSNELTGHIPSSLANLSSLNSLDLSDNKLVGTIPPSLANCSSLVLLGLSHNRLHGEIPASLGRLNGLNTLEAEFNMLTGAVPPAVYNLSSLCTLNVGMNWLAGALPPGIGHALPMLQTLVMQGNMLRGPIPASFSNASMLTHLDLSANQFSGLIPDALGRVPPLRTLNLGRNLLGCRCGDQWSFLTSLANCTDLKVLILSSNSLHGSLPREIGNLSTQLEWLELAGNELTGSIPAEISNLLNLTKLSLQHNRLVGSIPTEIGNLSALKELNLSRNNLTGAIPASLGSITELLGLDLSSNHLHGSIPTSFGNYGSLNLLNLSYNYLSGPIPKEIVSISSLSQLLDLSHNSLSGQIPSQIGSLTNLVMFDASHNKLSGEIPSNLGSCVVLQFVNIEDNSLRGTIPHQLNGLRSIQELDLSNNSLSGGIPEFLAQINSLKRLDLSFNDLEGDVPTAGVFADSTAVSLEGNSKLCNGNPRLMLPICSIRHAFPVIKVILASACVAICSILVLGFALCRSNRKCTSTPLPDDRYIKISYSELRKATDGFSSGSLTGVGSFGSVYRGRISGYTKDVAVKVLNLERRGALKSFMAECEALRNIRHRNLVKIVTSCSTIDAQGNDFRALIFEFMPNGSIEDWLHPKAPDVRRLTLAQRLNVAIDVASALEYLHGHGETPIVHCDLKPSNVLLDEDMTARVGDFGLAKFVGQTPQDSSYSLAIKGSIGYVAPEYGMGEQPSTQGDVFSYGILVLEMLTGKRPTDDMFRDGLDLRNFVEAALAERVMEIVDERAVSWETDGSNPREGMEECLVAMFRVGLFCCREAPSERLKMEDAVIKMKAIRDAYLGLKD